MPIQGRSQPHVGALFMMKKQVKQMKKNIAGDDKQNQDDTGTVAGGGRSAAFNKNIIRDSKTAKERGARGGKKAAETKRMKRDAQSSARYMLDLAAKGSLDKNLATLGYEENERTNMAALHAKLLTMAMAGDLQAYIQLMKTAGYDTEELRKDRDLERRISETEARIYSITNGDVAGISYAESTNDDGDSYDTVIYVPDNGRLEKVKEDKLAKVEEPEGKSE